MISARWLKLGVITLVLAVALHVLIVWLVPIVIMRTVVSRVSQQAGVNRVIAQPLPTDTSRGVVKPSPDLLYALCVFDVSGGPVQVSIKPPDTYWSLSLFDTNTDNVFKISAADVRGGIAEIVLGRARDGDDVRRQFPTATFFVTPHTKGVILARILVLDKSNMAEAVAAQKSVRCNAFGGKG